MNGIKIINLKIEQKNPAVFINPVTKLNSGAATK